MIDNTKRFSDRAEDYVKYRPHYPEGLVQKLEEVIGLNPSKIIADIGSGTGLSSLPFLNIGYTVIGVEPNKEMREAAEQSFSFFPNYRSVNGSAEKTNLPAKSVDLIFSGQAFHWFNKEKSKTEFSRILKHKGNIVLVWNERSTGNTFQQEYERILCEHIEEYKFVSHRNVDEGVIAQFFSPKKMYQTRLGNSQVLDLSGLVGRLRSSSYCPKSGEQYNTLMKEIALLFEKYKRDDTIIFEYETKIYWC